MLESGQIEMERMMSNHDLLRALRNERVLAMRPFHEKGFFPGPEPALQIPASSLLVGKENKVFYIGYDELIKLVGRALESV